MTSIHDPGPEDLGKRVARILRAIDDAPVPAVDASSYVRWLEDLRLLVEDLLGPAGAGHQSAGRVWLVRDCEDLVACCDTEDEAVEARADLQHWLACDYGPDPYLRESITITPVLVEPVHLARTEHAG